MDSPAKGFSERGMRVAVLFLLCCITLAGHAADYALERGEIEGAKFTIAKPARWNRQVLLLAHGFRPEGAELLADLYPDRGAYQPLVREGWMIAKTSYRRNGVIILDAMKDLDLLRQHIIRTHGPATRILIEGESMGGLIALLLAERTVEASQLYHGVVAIGPALQMREPASLETGLSMQPKIPVVFLANRSEFEPCVHYAAVKLPPELRPYSPALLRVNRDGHLNVNQAERLLALRTLDGWLDLGLSAIPMPESARGYIDATRIPEPLPSRVYKDEDGRGFTAHVSEVTSMHGNLLLDVQPQDFADIGLKKNAYFQVTLRERTVRVFFGSDFKSVNRGDWVAFENADGFFWLARNGLSAAEATQAQVGDVVHVRRYAEAPVAPP